jgi:hypothetical protein
VLRLCNTIPDKTTNPPKHYNIHSSLSISHALLAVSLALLTVSLALLAPFLRLLAVSLPSLTFHFACVTRSFAPVTRNFSLIHSIFRTPFRAFQTQRHNLKARLLNRIAALRKSHIVHSNRNVLHKCKRVIGCGFSE